MASVSVSETIQAPVDRVFALFSDFHHCADHVAAIKHCEVLTDGPVGQGTRFRETRVMYGREATEEMEVTAFDPGKHYRVEARSHGAHYISDFHFVPQGDATQVTMTFEARAESLFARLMSIFSKAMLKSVARGVHQDMLDLKRAAES